MYGLFFEGFENWGFGGMKFRGGELGVSPPDRVAHLDDPRSIGEALKGSRFHTLWKYRVGDYRIITSIEDNVARIIIVKIGDRKEGYR
jgi:mRNA-degrading endonuclease RelE of RelBE toxin-antitoxin system